MHAILVHGWKGWPDNAWFPWLRRELEKQGMTTEALKMPNPLWPDRREWIKTLSDAITGPETILIGHSLGCPTILFALQAHHGPPIHQAVLVAGFCRTFPFPLVDQWFDGEQIDMSIVKKKAKHWSVLHAKTDIMVPFKEGEWLAEQLGVPMTEVKSSWGHIAPENLAFEVPEILEAIVGKVRSA